METPKNPLLHSAQFFFLLFNPFGFPVKLHSYKFLFSPGLLLAYLVTLFLGQVSPAVFFSYSFAAIEDFSPQYYFSKTGLSAFDSALLGSTGVMTMPTSIVILFFLYQRIEMISDSFMAIAATKASMRIEKPGRQSKLLMQIWAVLMTLLALICMSGKAIGSYKR